MFRAAARGPQCAPGVLWRRLAARSLLPLEPKLQYGENRAESRVSPRKSDRQGLFYGEGEGAGCDASISGRTGTESPEGGSPLRARDLVWGIGQGQRPRCPRLLGVGQGRTDQSWEGDGPRAGKRSSPPPGLSPLSRIPLCSRGLSLQPGPCLPAGGGGGGDFLPRNT